MTQYASIQLIVLNWMNLLILIYTGANRPMKDRFSNRLEMANELFVCFISLCWYLFTDWVLDKNHQTDRLNLKYH